MRFFIFTVCIFACFGNLFSQSYPGHQVGFIQCTDCPNTSETLCSYSSDKTYYQTSQVTSDYGVRDPKDPKASKFHLGLDLSGPNQLGDAAISIDPGTILSIRVQYDNEATGYDLEEESKLKYIVIKGNDGHIYSYMHIFENGVIDKTTGMRVGNFVLTKSTNGNWAIIDLINCRALSAYNGETVNYSTSCTNNSNQTNSYITQKTIGFEQPIAPIGKSGTKTTHLHLSQIESGTNPGSPQESIDPWTSISHPKTYFTEEIKTEHSAEWWKIEPRYTGDTRNTIKLRSSMIGAAQINGNHYSNVSMDEQEIEILIKNLNALNAEFKTIEGLKHESKFVINPAGPKVIYPSYSWFSNGNWGSAIRTGIDPHAYTGGSLLEPYDDYYFADFYTRIHKDCSRAENNPNSNLRLAKYPWDSRLQDGDYNLKTRITNVRNEFEDTQGELPAFKIDNFKPFIKGINVYYKDGDETSKIYSRFWGRWNEQESEIILGKKSIKGITSLAKTGYYREFEIHILTSEPMDSVTVSMPALFFASNIIATPENDERTQWVAHIVNPYILFLGQCYDIKIEGKDYNNNHLLDLPKPSNCVDEQPLTTKIPIRIGENSWSNSDLSAGLDMVHKVSLIECGGGIPHKIAEKMENIGCIDPDEITYETHYTSHNISNGEIKLNISGNHPGILVSWRNGQNIPIGSGLTISNLSPGIYCYEIRDECCIVSDCIEIKECNLTISSILQHPTLNESNGSILLIPNSGVEPYQFKWSNNTSSNPAQNLTIGTYTVTIQDAFYCEVVSSFTLINCPTINVSLNPILYNPSSCNTTDGYIKILNGPTISGGVPPYTYSWEDQNGNPITVSSLGQPYNLAPGKYCFIVTDALGCRGSQCFDLFPDHFPQIFETISPACTTADVGQIDLTAFDPQGGNYNFEWSTGDITINEISSLATNLSTGLQCVTITSTETSCTIERCFEVPTLSPEALLAVATSMQNPCSNAPNGSIQLAVSGGVPPYRFNWSDLVEYDEPKDRVHLAQGNYTVTVSDYCGATSVKTFNLTGLSSSVSIIQNPGCYKQGIATAMVSGGNPPYSYKWASYGQYLPPQQTITQLTNGIYNVTVTDSKGCTATASYTHKNRAYTFDITQACEGTPSGKIDFTISNPPPSIGYVKIEFNGLPVYENTNSGPEVKYTANNLGSDQPYTYKITIDDCVYTQASSTIGSKQTEKRFVRYFKDQCSYEEYCDGVALSPGTYLYNDPAYVVPTSGRGCHLDIMCGSNKVGEKEGKHKTMRFAEYQQLLYYYEGIGLIPPDNAEELSNYAACTKVKVCLATMEIVASYSVLGVDGMAVSTGNGCFDLHCGFFSLTNSSFCLNEIINSADWITIRPPSDFTGCKIIKQNLFQLMVWAEQIGATFPNFYGSELDLLLQQYQGDIRAHCAYIYFCENDFKVLSPPNFMDLVKCNDYPEWYTEDQWGNVTYMDCNSLEGLFSGDFPCLSYVCLDPSNPHIIFDAPNPDITGVAHGDFVYICPDFPGEFFQSSIPESRNKIITKNVIKPKEDFGVLVYPNPSTQVFNAVLYSIVPKNISFEVFDLLGKRIYYSHLPIAPNIQTTHKFEVTQPSGVYILKITDGSGNYKIQKIVKS